MTKLILSFILILFLTGNSYSQFRQLIYENPTHSTNFQSIQVQSFNFTSGQPKHLFYQAGIGSFEGAPCMSQPTHHNTFRFNQFTHTSVIPYNGFLDRRGCQNVFGSCFWYVIRNYSISHNDQDFLIAHHRYSNELGCGDTLYETNITYDGGISKTPILPGLKFLGMEIDPVNDSNVYLASSNTVFKSINRGQSFQVTSSDHSITGFIKVSPQNNSIIFLRVNGGMKISTNAGIGFSNLAVPEFTDMAFRDSNEVLATSMSGVFKSTNEGLSWSQISGIQNINTIELDPDQDNIIYLGTNQGVFRSVTGGITFNGSAMFFEPDHKIYKISKDPNSLDTLYVVSNQGIFKVWNLLVSNETISTEIPQEFSINQNYPNPFNPLTNIKIEIPEGAFVTLKIFDISGREIATLHQGELVSGSYNFSWNAASQPSGIYFARMTAGDFSTTNFSKTIKLVLSK